MTNLFEFSNWRRLIDIREKMRCAQIDRRSREFEERLRAKGVPRRHPGGELGKLIDFLIDATRGTVAIEFAIISIPMTMLVIGGLYLGLAEMQIMGVRAGVSNVAAVASTKTITQSDAATMVCNVTPMRCDLISTSFDAGSPGGVGTVTSSITIDLSVIPFLNLSPKPITVSQNFVVKP